jgi:phospholipid transport system transporter-binding protein
MPSAPPTVELVASEHGWNLVGDITFASVPGLLAQVRNRLDFAGDLLIDCQGIDHSDSAGLALLLEWLDRSRQASGRIRYRHIPEALLNIARVSNVADLLPLGD